MLFSSLFLAAASWPWGRSLLSFLRARRERRKLNSARRIVSSERPREREREKEKGVSLLPPMRHAGNLVPRGSTASPSAKEGNIHLTRAPGAARGFFLMARYFYMLLLCTYVCMSCPCALCGWVCLPHCTSTIFSA
ncbi:hypothetical protein IWX46DRAFT_42733 [Phyllosticta citricarpa]|uniref:Uncharacterized protein n=1 Tax=Phyllosticta citricarpa TaxID=55181 RepID=A0ABR1MKG8_9PEZI